MDEDLQQNENNLGTNPEAPLTGQVVVPPPLKPKWYKSKAMLILLIILLLGGAVAAWMLTQKDKTATPNKPSQNNTSQTPKTLKPYALAYAVTTQGATDTTGCATSKAQASIQPLAGGDSVPAADLGKNNYINWSGVHQNEVYIITDRGCGSDDATTVWLSTDAGKTYSKVFSGKTSTDDDAMQDQVTSAVFANDGKTLLAAFLPADGTKNTVKEINLTTKAVKDLFTVDARGVFLKGYNHTTGQVAYYTGCYNCDGNNMNKLFLHDVAKNADTLLYEDTKHIGVEATPNSDLTKFMLVKGVAGEFLGASDPYTIEEFDVATKAVKSLATVNENTIVKAGYREGDGLRYYTKAKSIYLFDANGVATSLYEAANPILDVFYIGQDQIVFSNGEYSSNAIDAYNLNTKKSAKILDGNDHTMVFGVTWN